VSFVVTHIPHAVPVVAVWGILVRYWLVQRRLEREAGRPAGSAASSPRPFPAVGAVPARPAPRVRRSVAARGLVALGPLIGALATGLVIYAIDLGRGHAGQAAIWVHVGLSLLALLLVAYKVADIGLGRMRDSLVRAPAWRTAGSVVLLVLWLPLLASGIALLVAPSKGSFTAYAHLIASVWWTGLLLWHLRRYLARAARTVLAGPGLAAVSTPPTPAPTGRSVSRPPVAAGDGARADARPTPVRRPTEEEIRRAGPASCEDAHATAGRAATDEATAPVPGRYR
jgi:hypothetical protein